MVTDLAFESGAAPEAYVAELGDVPWLPGIKKRVVLAVANVPDAGIQIRRLRQFIRDHRPVIVADAAVVSMLTSYKIKPSVIAIGTHVDLPPLRKINDVLLCGPNDAHFNVPASLSRRQIRTHRVVTTGTPFDALLEAVKAASPRLLVTVTEGHDEILEGATLMAIYRRVPSWGRRFRRGVLSLLVVAAVGAAGVAGGIRWQRDHADAATTVAPPVPVLSTPAVTDTTDADALASLAPALVAGRLTGTRIALVALKGTSTSDIDAMSSLLTSAGATTVTYGIGARAFDPAAQSIVAALSRQLEPTQSAAAGTYEALGEAVGQALATTSAAKSFTTVQDGAYRALKGAGLLGSTIRKVGNAAGAPATKIVLLGDISDSDATQTKALASFVAGLRAHAINVVQTSGDTAANVEAIVGLD